MNNHVFYCDNFTSYKEGFSFTVCVCCQILETIPISDEVSDLVQTLGNFYTEVDGEREEGEDTDVDSRPYTRPFANHAGNLHDRRCHDKKAVYNNRRALLLRWMNSLVNSLCTSHR